MKIKFETTVQTSENTKERMVCLDISENIKSIRFEFEDYTNNLIKDRLEISIKRKFKVPHCICRESNCGCWSTVVTLIAVDVHYENAIVHMIMNKRI